MPKNKFPEHERVFRILNSSFLHRISIFRFIAWFFFHSHTCRACLVSWEVSWKECRGSLEMSNGMQWRHLVHLTLHALDVSSSCKDLNVPERWDGTDGTSDGRRNSQDIRGTEALWASPLPKQLHCRRSKTRHARCSSFGRQITEFEVSKRTWNSEWIFLHPWYLATFVKDRLKVPRNLKAQNASKSLHRLHPVLQQKGMKRC